MQSPPLELSFALFSPPECAARVRGISKLRGSFQGPVRPKVRSSEVRASVRDRPRSISFRPSPAIPGTAARVRALSEADPRPIGSIQTVLQSLVPADTCATLCDASHPLELVAGTGSVLGLFWVIVPHRPASQLISGPNCEVSRCALANFLAQ